MSLDFVLLVNPRFSHNDMYYFGLPECRAQESQTSFLLSRSGSRIRNYVQLSIAQHFRF
jgi:hypothetical protein